jgi:hypothetical protein
VARGFVPAEGATHRALGAGDAVATALAEDLALTERDVELGLLEDLVNVVLGHAAFLGDGGASLDLVGGAFLARHAALLGTLLLPVEEALELVLLAIDAALCEFLGLLVRIDLLGVDETGLVYLFEDRLELLVKLGSFFLFATALGDVGALLVALETVLLLDALALGFGGAQLENAAADGVLDLDPLGAVVFEDGGLTLVLLIAPGVVGGQLLLLIAPGGVGVDGVDVHFHVDSWRGCV